MRRTERRVAINSSLLLGAFGFQSLVSIVIVGLVARYLGQAGLGRYAYIISFIELFIPLIDLGMSRIEVREISRDLARAGRYSSATFSLRLLLSLATLIIVGLLAAQNGDQELWLATMVYFLAQALYLMGDVYSSVFHGFQRMEYQFWGLNISQLVLLVVTVLVIQLDMGLVWLFGARLIANAVKVLIVLLISERRFAKTRFVGSLLPGMVAGLGNLPGAPCTERSERMRRRLASRRPPKRVILRPAGAEESPASADGRQPEIQDRWTEARLAWRMLVDSIPVGISLILRSYIWRGGIVLTVLWLGQTQGDLINGVLYGPLRVVQQMRIVPAAFAAAMLPVFSNRVVDRMDEFDTAFAKSIKLFVAISLLISLAFTFLADPVVKLLLGEDIDLAQAALVLVVLGWVVVLFFLNWLYGVTLVALGKQQLETLGLAAGLVVGFLVSAWGIPRLGALGVSLAVLAAEGVFFVIGTVAMWPHFHWRGLTPSLVKIAAGCALAGLVFAVGGSLWSSYLAGWLGPGSGLNALAELLVVGSVGFLVFVVALALLGTFDADETDAIRAMLRLKRTAK